MQPVARYLRHLWDDMSETGRQTFPWDLTRGAAAGAIGTIQATFALLVAIRYFEATTLQKSMIAGAHAAGLLLSLPYVAWSPVLRLKTVRTAVPIFLAAVGLAVAALAPSASWYTAGVVLFAVSAAMPVPMMTAIYRDNYRGRVRGQVFGLTVALTIVAGLSVQAIGGVLLNLDMALFRIMFGTLAALALVMAFSILKMPNPGAPEPVRPNPLGSFTALRENPMFAYVLAAWFLFGFANLGLEPQRIEYLSQPQYGLALSPGMIVLIAGVTLEVARLAGLPIWARLFDRYNFIWLRIVMCGFMLAHILVYYHATTLPVLLAASVLLGISYGGGAIAWALWVTKFAPPEETSRYMSVHSFLTGVRGTVGPFIGYLVVEHLTIGVTAWLAAGMIAAAMLMLFIIRKMPERT